MTHSQGTEAQTKFVVKCRIIPALKVLLKHKTTAIRQQATFALSNIVVADETNVCEVFAAEIMPDLLQLLDKEPNGAVQANALFTFNSVLKQSTDSQIDYLLGPQRCVRPVWEALRGLLDDGALASVADRATLIANTLSSVSMLLRHAGLPGDPNQHGLSCPHSGIAPSAAMQNSTVAQVRSFAGEKTLLRHKENGNRFAGHLLHLYFEAIRRPSIVDAAAAGGGGGAAAGGAAAAAGEDNSSGGGGNGGVGGGVVGTLHDPGLYCIYNCRNSNQTSREDQVLVRCLHPPHHPPRARACGCIHAPTHACKKARRHTRRHGLPAMHIMGTRGCFVRFQFDAPLACAAFNARFASIHGLSCCGIRCRSGLQTFGRMTAAAILNVLGARTPRHGNGRLQMLRLPPSKSRVLDVVAVWG